MRAGRAGDGQGRGDQAQRPVQGEAGRGQGGGQGREGRAGEEEGGETTAAAQPPAFRATVSVAATGRVLCLENVRTMAEAEAVAEPFLREEDNLATALGVGPVTVAVEEMCCGQWVPAWTRTVVP